MIESRQFFQTQIFFIFIAGWHGSDKKMHVKQIKITKNKIIALAILLIQFALFSSLFIKTNVKAENTEQEFPPANFYFSPFKATKVGYQVLDENYNVIGTVTGDDYLPWHDPNHKFPNIDVWISEPFLTDYTGMNVYSPEEYPQFLAGQNIVEASFEDGRQKFLVPVHLAVDVAVVTRTNLPTTSYQSIPISLLVGESAEYQGGYSGEVFQRNGQPPIGVLIAETNVGASGWPCTWQLTNAYIRNSLEDFRNPNWISNMQTNYGNSLVYVVPEIRFDAFENFITWDYYKEVNDEAFRIYSEETQMAITNVKAVTAAISRGPVPNYNPLANQQLDLTLTDATGGSGASTQQLSSDDLAGAKDNYQAFLKYSGVDPDEVFGDRADVNPNIQTSLSVYDKLHLDQFDNYDKSCTVKRSVTIQPRTTVKIARYSARAVGKIYTIWDKWYRIRDETGRYPYRIEITNNYVIYRLVFTIAILSVNRVLYIPAEGSAIAVTDISEYGINAAGMLNPDWGSISGFTVHRTALEEALGGLGFEWPEIDPTLVITIIVLVVIGIVAVVVAIVVSKFRRIF